MGSQIKLSSAGTPFANEAAAKAQLKRQNLDDGNHAVGKYGGGWAIFDLTPIQSGDAVREKMEESQQKQAKNMRYFWVRWHEKRHTNDEEDVKISCDGKILIWKRGERTIAPESHLLIADESGNSAYKKVPGEMRKVPNGRVKTYGYDRFGEATREQYHALLKGAPVEEVVAMGKKSSDDEDPDDE